MNSHKELAQFTNRRVAGTPAINDMVATADRRFYDVVSAAERIDRRDCVQRPEISAKVSFTSDDSNVKLRPTPV